MTPIFDAHYLYPRPHKAASGRYAELVQFRIATKTSQMNSQDPPSIPATIAVKRIGSIAARKRRELEHFEAERQRSLEKLNQAHAKLKNALKEAEGLERRHARQQQTDAQRQLKFVLGGLVLGVLRAQGAEAFAFTAQDLSQLQEKDRLCLAEVLGVSPERKTCSETAIEPASATAAGSDDVPL